MTSSDQIDHAIYQTVRYFNLFDQPVTAVQLWRTLIIDPKGRAGQRWHGLKQATLANIRERLQNSQWLKEQLGSRLGYYYLHGRDELVETRMRRHVLAQMKWKLTQRVVRLLRVAPFVRMIAFSGSLSAGNTRPSSDLDLFVVAKAKHVWTARLFLLGLSQLLGRRRRYWDEEAPDKVCLNHYVTDTALTMPSDIHNVYTAVLYHWLIPVTGTTTGAAFADANRPWMQQFLMYKPALSLASRLVPKGGRLTEMLKKFLENMLSEPVFSWVEPKAEALQRRAIARHAKPGQRGRVALSGNELAFHPDTKVPSLLAKYFEEEGQQQLL